MSNLVVFDTSVFVDYLRIGKHAGKFEATAGIVRNLSVVLAELWRGATTKPERKFLYALERNHPTLTPSARIWLASGELLGRMYDAQGFVPGKLRDLHFDVLIALTAHANGARLVTSNARDFELIASYRAFDLEVW